MRHSTLALIFLFLAQNLTPSLDGRVTDSANDSPLAGIQVGVTPILSRDATTAQISRATAAVRPVTTDAQGRFSFPSLPPGRYRVWASGNGYARREFGSSLSGNSGQQTGTVIDVGPERSVRDLSLRLVGAGSVSGRLLSDMGAPLTGLQLLLLRTRYNEDGHRFLETEASGWSNDRGEYRLSGVAPGQYYIVARGQIRSTPIEVQLVSGQTIPDASDGKYSTTYFPGTTDFSRAALVEVNAARNTGGTDFVLPRSKGYHIRGRVIEEATGRMPASVGFTLLPRPSFGPVQTGVTFGSAYDRQAGTFDVRFPGTREEGFAPGPYWLIATRGEIVGEPAVAGLVGRQARRVAIDIGNSDLENVQIILRKPVPLKGRISVAGQTALPAEIRTANVLLLPNTDFPWPPTIGNPRSQHTPIQADGSFLYENLIPDTYEAFMDGLPREAFLQALGLGSVTTVASALTLSGTSSDTLNVIVSLSGARIAGMLRDEKSQPVRNHEVILIPDTSRNRRDLYKRATTDGRGAFLIEGVAPGSYKAFAWENVEPFNYFDPAFMTGAEQQGRPVTATESARLTLDLTLITN